MVVLQRLFSGRRPYFGQISLLFLQREPVSKCGIEELISICGCISKCDAVTEGRVDRLV